jgi:hypothetical protein
LVQKDFVVVLRGQAADRVGRRPPERVDGIDIPASEKPAQKRKFCNGFGEGLPPDGRRRPDGQQLQYRPFQLRDY